MWNGYASTLFPPVQPHLEAAQAAPNAPYAAFRPSLAPGASLRRIGHVSFRRRLSGYPSLAFRQFDGASRRRQVLARTRLALPVGGFKEGVAAVGLSSPMGAPSGLKVAHQAGGLLRLGIKGGNQ